MYTGCTNSILTTTNIGNVPFKHDALDHLGRVEWQPMPFAVKGDARWGTFEEFANECRANPGTLKVANSGTGSATHLAAIAIVEAIGCEVVHLPVGIKRRNASVLSGEVVPLLLALVLGRPLEEHLRVALTGSQGDPTVFFTSPFSVLFLALSVFSVAWSLWAHGGPGPTRR